MAVITLAGVILCRSQFYRHKSTLGIKKDHVFIMV
nr:MAG TPA: hypothetical protein [Caudoviricetes sp.]